MSYVQMKTELGISGFERFLECYHCKEYLMVEKNNATDGSGEWHDCATDEEINSFYKAHEKCGETEYIVSEAEECLNGICEGIDKLMEHSEDCKNNKRIYGHLINEKWEAINRNKENGEDWTPIKEELKDFRRRLEFRIIYAITGEPPL